RGLLLLHRGDRFSEFIANALLGRAGPRLERVHVGVPRVDIALDRCRVRCLIGRVLGLELRVNYGHFSIRLVELEAELNVGSLPGELVDGAGLAKARLQLRLARLQGVNPLTHARLGFLGSRVRPGLRLVDLPTHLPRPLFHGLSSRSAPFRLSRRGTLVGAGTIWSLPRWKPSPPTRSRYAARSLASSRTRPGVIGHRPPKTAYFR